MESGPARYPEIAKKYQPLTPRTDRLAVDINIVDRYQDVYPTKQQTGVELFELVHTASQAFSRVALYFENSILPSDTKLLSFAGGSPRSFERSADSLTVDCPPGLGWRHEGPVLVDGQLWPVLDGGTVWLPVGKHVVKSGIEEVPLRIIGFNGTLTGAKVAGSRVSLDYESNGRAIALIDRTPGEVSVEAGRPAVVLPGRGSNRDTVAARPAHSCNRCRATRYASICCRSTIAKGR